MLTEIQKSQTCALLDPSLSVRGANHCAPELSIIGAYYTTESHLKQAYLSSIAKDSSVPMGFVTCKATLGLGYCKQSVSDSTGLLFSPFRLLLQCVEPKSHFETCKRKGQMSKQNKVKVN
jgi:hypothetical protein